MDHLAPGKPLRLGSWVQVVWWRLVVTMAVLAALHLLRSENHGVLAVRGDEGSVMVLMVCGGGLGGGVPARWCWRAKDVLWSCPNEAA